MGSDYISSWSLLIFLLYRKWFFVFNCSPWHCSKINPLSWFTDWILWCNNSCAQPDRFLFRNGDRKWKVKYLLAAWRQDSIMQIYSDLEKTIFHTQNTAISGSLFIVMEMVLYVNRRCCEFSVNVTIYVPFLRNKDVYMGFCMTLLLIIPSVILWTIHIIP